MPIVAFDTETELIGPGKQDPPLVCLSYTSAIGQEKLVHVKHAFEIAEKLLLEALPKTPLVGHNVAFDLCVLGRQFPKLLPLIFDAYEADAIACTYVQQKLLDIADGRKVARGKTPYSLATLAQHYLGQELDKDTWRLRYGELKARPINEWPQGAVDYAKLDARATFEVFQAQECSAHGDILADAPAQCRADFALKLAANRGMITCPKRVEKFVVGIEQEFSETRQLLLTGGLLKEQKKKGATVFVRDTKKAQARLLNILGDNVEMTPTGLVKVDEDSCLASGDELLVKYNRFLKLQTLMSKDAAILQRGTHEPIHTNFNVLVNTGRTSSRNPNMQNPRREPGVRECFVPRPGYVFASADYDAAELHTLAQVCLHFCGGSSVLARQLNVGVDPHLALAAELLKISYDKAVELKNDDDKKVLEMRQIAKAANFGFPGGMGPRGFRAYAKGYGFNISIDDATKLRKNWLRTFPEMVRYFHYISAKVAGTGYTRICHLISKRQRGLVKYTAACNSYFQGLAADGAKRALFEVQRECHVAKESALFGSQVINFLHDEIIIETPESRAHEAATRLALLMVQNFNHFVPDVPVTASPQLMRLWSKKAKPIFDNNGRLVPWEEK